MSFNPLYEASKALPLEQIADQLNEFAAMGQDLSSRRFSQSPPSVPSVASTTWEESQPPSPGVQIRKHETEEMENSTAGAQFRIQIDDEKNRIREASEKNMLQRSSHWDLEGAAEANVRYRWKQQGIWDEQWDTRPSKIWKHEQQDPSLLERTLKSPRNGRIAKLGNAKKWEGYMLKEEYDETVRCAIDSQTRQLSRPCYQFVYQFCMEREWIKMGLGKQEHGEHDSLDARAYGMVKSRWIRDGLWDNDWTLIPGIWWRHERPRKFKSTHEASREKDARRAAKVEQAERPPQWYFVAPTELPATFNRFACPPDDVQKSRETEGATFSASAHKSATSATSQKENRQTPATQKSSPTNLKPKGTEPARKASPSKRNATRGQRRMAGSKPEIHQNKDGVNATTSRPRRSAAVKALQNMAQAAGR